MGVYEGKPIIMEIRGRKYDVEKIVNAKGLEAVEAGWTPLYQLLKMATSIQEDIQYHESQIKNMKTEILRMEGNNQRNREAFLEYEKMINKCATDELLDKYAEVGRIENDKNKEVSSCKEQK